MGEHKNRARDKRGKGPNTILRWAGRYWLSAALRKRQLYISNNIRNYDWRTWSHQFDITITWYGYKFAITVASLTAFTTGIGQLFFKLTGH